MPLIRIETRPKPGEPPAKPPGQDKKGRDASARPARSGTAKPAAAAGRTSLLPVLVAGGLFGLIIVAGLSAFFVARSRSATTAPGAAGVPAAAAAPGGAAPAAPGGGGAAASIWPGPINSDYPRDQPIAFVNNEPYTMAQLETAVRMARALGTLSGDEVPAYTDQAILTYQVRLLKRQIDQILMRQAVQREGLAPPTGPVDDLISGFVQRVGTSDARLDAELATNGVTRDDLRRWFEDSRTTSFYVQTKLMADETDQSKRDAIVQAWLAKEWERLQAQNLLLINFYDPDKLKSPAAAPGAVPGGAAPAGVAPTDAAPAGGPPGDAPAQGVPTP